MSELLPPPPTEEHARWRFLRDVAVFELKLALNNLHNFVQIPLTLAVAVFDLVFKGKSEGERFYHLVDLGRTIDDSIGIYSIIDHRQRRLNDQYTVDAVLKHIDLQTWRFAYQSQGRTTDPWLGPTVEATLDDLHREGHRHVARRVHRAREQFPARAR